MGANEWTKYITGYSKFADSLSELADEAAKCSDSVNGASQDSDDNFAGCNFQEAIRLCKEGWPEGMREAQRLLDEFNRIMPPEPTHKQLTYQVSGGAFVDVGRYCSFDPECFGTYQTNDKPKSPLTIVVNCCYSGGISTEAIMRGGVAICAAIDVLESRGYDVELLAAIQSNDDLRYVVRLKDQGEPLNIDKLVFSLAHAAFLRRIGFALMEGTPAQYRQKHGYYKMRGYGRVHTWRPEDAELVFDGTHLRDAERWKTTQDSVDWVVKTLKEHKLWKEEETNYA